MRPCAPAWWSSSSCSLRRVSARCGTFITIPDSLPIPSTSPAPSICQVSLPAPRSLCSPTSASTPSPRSRRRSRNPRRNILLATVLVCLITGLLSGLEVYAAQLIWGSKPFPSDQVESAFALVSRQVGGVVLFQIVNFTLLVANMGSGMGSQLAAGRLLYGMGRGNALPKSFFGAIEPKRRIPRNNIVAVGASGAPWRQHSGILCRTNGRRRL